MQNISENNSNRYKCIWMESNLVEYHLCDKEFDCDGCDFYKNINQIINHDRFIEADFHKKDFIVSNRINQLKNLFDSGLHNILYLKNYVKIKKMIGNIYYFGLSPHLQILLDNVSSAAFINKSNYISKGDDYFHISGDWGELVLTAPVNFSFIYKIEGDIKDIFNNKWLGFIDVDKDELQSSLLSSTDIKQYLDNTINFLEEKINTDLSIGITMQDGGKPLYFLYQILGKQEYLNLLKKNLI